MKLSIALLSLLALCLAVVPAMAQDVYDNGPINGNTDAWTINSGFTVSDNFLVSVPTNVGGLSFGAWLFPGDIPASVDVSITSSEFGGTSFFSGTVGLTTSGCVANGFGLDVCIETASFGPVNLAAGNYWLNLNNAVVPSGDPVYWDENSGPSSASQNSVGTIPSEAFTILGAEGTTTTTTTTTTTPEPTSIMLFGSGILGVAGVLRRKFL